MILKHSKFLGAAIITLAMVFLLTACALKASTAKDLRNQTFTTVYEGTVVQLNSQNTKTYYVHPYHYIDFWVDETGTIMIDTDDSGSRGTLAQRKERLNSAYLICSDNPEAVEVYVNPAHYNCASILTQATP